MFRTSRYSRWKRVLSLRDERDRMKGDVGSQWLKTTERAKRRKRKKQQPSICAIGEGALREMIRSDVQQIANDEFFNTPEAVDIEVQRRIDGAQSYRAERLITNGIVTPWKEY
jgi:hypothetical protein